MRVEEERWTLDALMSEQMPEKVDAARYIYITWVGNKDAKLR